MSFDNQVWSRPAVGGDVGGVAIDASVALDAIHSVLEKLSKAAGVDTSAELDEISRIAGELHESFTTLSGWIDENDA